MTSITAHIDGSLIDPAALGAWMDTQGLAPGAIEQLEPIGGGTQNIMVRFHRGGREFVLRRGPKHLRKQSNSVIGREARLLGALAGTDVAAPRLIAACTDETVLGAVFYLMEPVAGFNASVGLPELHAADAAVRRQMGLEAASALATLGAVDYLAVGLEGFGKPEGFLERQVPRWLGELESYRAFEGYDGPDIPHLDFVAQWIEDNRPAQWTPGVMHGDYHLANIMFALDGPQVAAIVDWEMCTIGDPLLDLGWLLATWPRPDGLAIAGQALQQAGGLPTRSELVAHYAERSDRDLSAMPWYTVLAGFKLAIILEGTYARACAGKASEALGAMLHAAAVALLADARKVVDEGLG